jgi:serine/threonine protein kinase/Tol biopolymer transport system component
MPISPGTRLGPYEILAPIGAGGMGEVYRARDTRLDRTVAVKILPARFAEDAEMRKRFEREARAISALSHPHICALHDVGSQDGVEYLVMEYLEGQALADRLAKGAIPLDQTLKIGAEIADALAAAHAAGILHRDLKPGNVMLTKSGVKLLDFGLAKPGMFAAGTGSATELPTRTSAPLTEKGFIAGTLQYMSPEQLEAKDPDARSDIFALGAVLYEMTTGRKAFEARSQASLIAAILEKDPPPVSQVQPVAPPALDRLILTCLAKDPDQRWQTARDVARELRWVERSAEEAPAKTVGRRKGSAPLAWAVAALGVAAAIGMFAVSRRNASRQEILRAYISPPPNTSFHFLEANCGPVAVSPDGRRLAFSAVDALDTGRLWLRPLDAEAASPIPGTEGALFPFWSPDGRSLGFYAGGKLRTVEASASAAPPRALADVDEARGGSWGPDGTILFCPSNSSPLYRVPASGGKPITVTTVAEGERNHPWPWFLPDGRHFLYEIRFEQPERDAIYVGSLDSKEKRLLVQVDSNVVYTRPGYLLFRKAGRLVAVPFDADSLTIEGEAVELTKGLESFPPTGGSIFSASPDLLAFAPESQLRQSRLVWLDRSGKEVGSLGAPAKYISPRISPNGRQVAVSITENVAVPPNVWLYDIRLGTGTRLTHRPRAALVPVFSPDGSRIVFSSYGRSTWDLFEVEVSHPGRERVLLQSRGGKSPNDFSPDGQFLLYREFSSETRGDLKFLPLAGDRQPRTFIASPYDEGSGVFSPDGRWVAYASDESGRSEIHVADFPDASRRYRVSSGGGAQPRWSRDGRELFFISGKSMMSVPAGRQGADLVFGQARTFFEKQLQTYGGTASYMTGRYDVSEDGRFLVLLRATDEAPPPLSIVLHWTELLKK